MGINCESEIEPNNGPLFKPNLRVRSLELTRDTYRTQLKFCEEKGLHEEAASTKQKLKEVNTALREAVIKQSDIEAELMSN